MNYITLLLIIYYFFYFRFDLLKIVKVEDVIMDYYGKYCQKCTIMYENNYINDFLTSIIATKTYFLNQK